MYSGKNKFSHFILVFFICYIKDICTECYYSQASLIWTNCKWETQSYWWNIQIKYSNMTRNMRLANILTHSSLCLIDTMVFPHRTMPESANFCDVKSPLIPVSLGFCSHYTFVCCYISKKNPHTAAQVQ